MASIQRLSREDHRRKKELDELRKAGVAPAEVDCDGNMINPHIPKYMAEAPWYVSDGKPGLKHLRSYKTQRGNVKVNDYIKRGRKATASKRFRKGACENCGAISHRTKECCERKRKKGAKFTEKNIQPDEIIPVELNHNFESKRDRWKEYDLNDHKSLIDYAEKAQSARIEKRDKELEEILQKDTLARSELEGKLHAEDNVEDPGLLMQQIDEKKRQTVRNLRTREHTAKYLYNLELDSSFYDPKTRSMRADPNVGKKGNRTSYLGDNFHRISGDSERFLRQKKFAEITSKKIADSQKGVLHMTANPTKAEMIMREFESKKKSKVSSEHQKIIDYYGGAEHMISGNGKRNGDDNED